MQQSAQTEAGSKPGVCVGHAACSVRPWQHLSPCVSGPPVDHPMVVRGEPPRTDTQSRTRSSYAPVYLSCSTGIKCGGELKTIPSWTYYIQ